MRVGQEQPRIFTPPLRELTPETSLGFSVIQFADELLGMELYPWQKWLLIHMLELEPGGRLRFRFVVVLIARQNGKSTLSVVLALWFMYVYGSRLILGTAQDLDTAEEVWQKAVDLVTELDEDDQPVRPELYDLHERVVMVNGKKSLELRTGERYKVKAANRRAGRGLSGDLINLDELREHQTWDAWAAVTKTTMARDLALVLAWSNAGDASSVVLRYLRKIAHLGLGDPDGINLDDDPDRLLEDESLAVDADEVPLGIFEWSAAPGCSLDDRDGWAQANPSLGYTISERTLAAARKTDPDWVFRTECLCQWSDDTLDGPFPPGTWEGCRDNRSTVARDSRVYACVDVSWDRSTSHVAVAGYRADGLPHAEVVASRSGTAWVVDWFTDSGHPHRAKWSVVVQATGAPASSLITPLAEAGLEVLEWKGVDLGKACGAFYDLVRSARFRHLTQPVLDVAASTAYTRPLGDAWVWDRKNSPHDAAPLVAVTGAIWALQQPVHELPPPPPPVALTAAAHDSLLSASF